MSYELVCVHPFGKYVKGQHVTDQAEIEKLLAEDRGRHFVKIPASR